MATVKCQIAKYVMELELEFCFELWEQTVLTGACTVASGTEGVGISGFTGTCTVASSLPTPLAAVVPPRTARALIV
jgi:hypothetical protein